MFPALTLFGRLGEELLLILFKCSVEFTSEAIWCSTFLCGEVLITDSCALYVQVCSNGMLHFLMHILVITFWLSLQRSYWYGHPRIRRNEEDVKGCGRTQSKYFEAESTSLVAGIQIKHLHKVLFQGKILYYPCPEVLGKPVVLGPWTGKMAASINELTSRLYVWARYLHPQAVLVPDSAYGWARCQGP